MKPSLAFVSLVALSGCAVAEGSTAPTPVIDERRPTAAPRAPDERSLFAEVLGPTATRRSVAGRSRTPPADCFGVHIDVARSAERDVESVVAAVPRGGEAVVVRGGAGGGWSVALAISDDGEASRESAGARGLRVAFEVSWTRPDGPPRFPGVSADAPGDAAPRDGSGVEVQYGLQGALTSGLRSLRIADMARPTALAVIPVGQEEAMFTLTLAPVVGRSAAARVDVCDEDLAARLREILVAGEPAGSGPDVRSIELVHESRDSAGFVCGTDATPISPLTRTRAAGEHGGTTRFAAADLRVPGSAAYLVRDAAWITDYVMLDGRVAPVVTRRRSGFAWLRGSDEWTLSESVVLRSTTPRPVTLADGRTLWADVLRAEDGPHVVATDTVDAVFAEEATAPR